MKTVHCKFWPDGNVLDPNGDDKRPDPDSMVPKGRGSTGGDPTGYGPKPRSEPGI